MKIFFQPKLRLFVVIIFKSILFILIKWYQVGLKPLTRLGLNTSALILVRDQRHNKFEDSLLGIVESSLCEGPIHFSCFPNFPISLSDPNIMKALTLNIKTEGFDMIDGTENVNLLYRICYKVMNSTISNFRINTNQISSKRGETTLFITDINKSNIMIPKTINWNQVTLPEIWKMESISPSLKEETRKLESIVH